MHVRRPVLVPAALVASLVVVGGCTRSYARKDPPRSTQPRADLPLDRGAVAEVPPPLPPDPPPLRSSVTPPQADDLARDLPPMPGDPVTPAGATGEVASLNDGDGPIRQRIRERREERRERREEQKKPPTKEPTSDAPKPPESVPESKPAAGADVRQLIDAGIKRYAEIPDFEARLVKQEVVNGKQIPRDEIAYRFRQHPMSVYMRVLSAEGQGREVLYVQGKFGNRMHVVTGKGDNRLVGAGYKTDLDPSDRQATSKSRYKITDAGFGRTFAGLQKQFAAGQVKSLGPVKRPEYPYPLDGLEITLRPGDDPLLPKGGTRQVFLDSKADSPSYRLPVLVRTTEPDGREVEYYCFDRIKVPSGWTDADWTPDRLGKK